MTISLRGMDEDDGAAISYYAPSVHSLLSDRFFDDHCLRPERGRRSAAGSPAPTGA